MLESQRTHWEQPGAAPLTLLSEAAGADSAVLPQSEITAPGTTENLGDDPNPSHLLLPCESFHTSNDCWRRTTAAQLVRRLESLHTGPDNTAALVVGAGTLPFTLDVLPPTIAVADLDAPVVRSVVDRCNFIANEGRSWDHYRDAFPEDPMIRSEYANMLAAGLVRDFGRVKEAAQKARFIPVVGDVAVMAPEVFADYPLDGKKLTFVNCTNVAQFMGLPGGESGGRAGRAIMAGMLGRLPLHEDAVICDSSLGQEVILYTPAQYAAFGR